jgi:hypothetical protein
MHDGTLWAERMRGDIYVYRVSYCSEQRGTNVSSHQRPSVRYFSLSSGARFDCSEVSRSAPNPNPMPLQLTLILFFAVPSPSPPTTLFPIILDSAHRPLPPSKKMARRRAAGSTRQNRARSPQNAIRFCRYEYMNLRTALCHARWSPVCAVIRTQMIVYAHVHRHPWPVRVGNLPRGTSVLWNRQCQPSEFQGVLICTALTNQTSFTRC